MNNYILIISFPADDFQQSVVTTEASTPLKPTNKIEDKPTEKNIQLNSSGNLTAEQLSVIAMNSGIPQQVCMISLLKS